MHKTLFLLNFLGTDDFGALMSSQNKIGPHSGNFILTGVLNQALATYNYGTDLK